MRGTAPRYGFGGHGLAQIERGRSVLAVSRLNGNTVTVEAAEQTILGMLMTNPAALDNVLPVLRSTDFHKPAHGSIYAAITANAASGEPTEPMAVAVTLADHEELARVGGAPYLHTLLSSAPAAGSVGWYAQRIAEASRVRRIETATAKLGIAVRTGDLGVIAAANRELQAELEATPADIRGWTKPVTAGTPALPEFPVKVLPPVLHDMVEAVSSEVQAPIAMAGMLSLAICASTLAGKVHVVGREGHVEELPLWVFVAAESAERKTPVFNLLRKPLIEFEKERAPQVELERRRQQSNLKVIQGVIAKLERDAVKNGLGSVQRDLELAQAEEMALKVPAEMKLWTSSPTPEAVHGLLSQHDGRMAVFADEGGIFGVLAGRYAGRSGGADLDPFLAGYVGSPLRASRVTAERKDVDHAFLTMGFAVQPSILSDIGAIPGAEERGLVGRFLFALPESLVGGRMYAGSTPVPDRVAAEYGKALRRWADLESTPGRRRLRLEGAAYHAYAEFHDSIERRNRRPDGDLAEISSWSGKVAGTTLRVAAVLHAFADPQRALERPVGLEAVAAAITLTEEFLIPHALAAFGVVRQGSASGSTARVLSWLASRRPTEFTLNEVFKALRSGSGRGGVQSKHDLMPALEQLEADGYVRRVEAPRKDTILFEVNPLWDFT
jgi:hypothetical protein